MAGLVSAGRIAAWSLPIVVRAPIEGKFRDRSEQPIVLTLPLPFGLRTGADRCRGEARVMKSSRIPIWAWLALAVAVGANQVASVATWFTVDLMGGVSELATEARRMELAIVPYFSASLYLVLVPLLTYYMWPVVGYFREGCPGEASLLVRRRAISSPFVVAAGGFCGWLIGVVFFPAFTLGRFGTWSGDLMSQQVLSPLINGFLAATVSYVLLDWVFRTMVVPRVFPEGRLAEVPGTVSLGVRGRSFVFLTAVAFVPLFTMLGLIRSASGRLAEGMPAGDLLARLIAASEITFVVYVVLGVVLTLIIARFVTGPLAESAAALRRVQQGDLDVSLQVQSGDEVGVLEDGVNDMVAALRDRERILEAFGRVVEPTVRDHLLSGRYDEGGELHEVSILFCDIRGFTSLSENNPPREVVATLNEFFTAMTDWVRECGGFVDKFIGDALLVVFGLFDGGGDGLDIAKGGGASPRDAAGAGAAVRCALGMRSRLGELNAERAAAGKPPLAVSVAVHSGEVVAGTIGSAGRHEYTVIGDTVNVAARLERLSKEKGDGVLVSEATYDRARAAGIEVSSDAAESVTLRGRSEPVRIFRLT